MRFSGLEGRTLAVWGLGRETRSFARQLGHRLPGASVAFGIAEDEESRDGLVALGATVITPAQAVGRLTGGDVVVRSPGVSIHRPEVRALRERGVAVLTPTALWLGERGGRGVVGVTGTKGKSTTATIVAHLLTATGARVELAGNIGRPALELLDRPAPEWTVLELSSYQIADLETGPETALVTNLFDEHVDWHGTAERYRADKLRLLSLPGVRRAVLPAGHPELATAVGAGVEVHSFGEAAGWHLEDGAVMNGAVIAARVAALPLRGEHNALNLCAALATVQALGLRVPDLPAALRGLTPLPHRLQTVRVADGIEWIDDSISTTPESALAALAALDGRALVLIAGGMDREQHHDALAAALARRGAALVGLPDTGERLVRAARAAGIPAERAAMAEDLPAAVERARALTAAGGVVLLSPAAPSYHRYRSFEERGDHFAALAAEA